VRIAQTPGDRIRLGSVAGGQFRRRAGEEQIVDVIRKPRRRLAQPGDLAGARVSMHEDGVIMLGDVARNRHVTVEHRVTGDLIVRP
jgi:hypothetical protein